MGNCQGTILYNLLLENPLIKVGKENVNNYNGQARIIEVVRHEGMEREREKEREGEAMVKGEKENENGEQKCVIYRNTSLWERQNSVYQWLFLMP